jgi:hypothetical protein
MTDREAKLHVNTDGTVSIDMGTPLPPGDYIVQIAERLPADSSVPVSHVQKIRWPQYDIAWDDTISLRREDMYD